jgi:hypothetical protein
VILEKTAAQVQQENSLQDIQKFFEPLKEHEFKDFWLALNKEEREEFRHADLRK